jgi:hypothetical protein
MITNKFQRDPGISEGTGPSLADLTDPNYVAPVPPADPVNDSPTTDSTDPTDEKDNDNVEIDDDNVEVDDEAISFWETVSGITGNTYDIDYGETDPISPEGVAIRESFVAETASRNFEDHLKNTHPKGYAYLLHLEAGGSDEEFFKQSTPTLPERKSFETDITAQSYTVLNDLINRGVDEEIAQAQVDKYIKDNTITERAITIYSAYEEAQRNQLKNIEAYNKQQQDLYNQNVNTLLSKIDATLQSDNLKYIVPEKKQQDFKKFVQDNIRYSEGNFYVTQQIEDAKMGPLMEQLLFQFNGGNLNGLIEKKARTLTTQRLKTAVSKDRQVQNNKGEGVNSKPGFIPLGEL